MKLTFTFLVAFLFTTSLMAQTFCLRLSEVSNDGTNFIVKIEMSGSSTFALGSSNLQWSYDPAKITNPTLESSILVPPFYSLGIGSPNPGETSFNIDLNAENFGSDINDTWTEIAQINYTVLDPSDVGELVWLYNGGTTQTIAYLDNEITQIFATNPACLEGLLAPLPVELLSFKAQKKGETVLLNWETASEINNRGFEVEKSKDALRWEKLAWVAGNGTSVLQQQYSLLDQEPVDGNNYYRLKVIAEDDGYSYSSIAQIRFEKAIAVKLFPNPSKGLVSLTYPSQHSLERVLVYDQVGSKRYEAVLSSDNTLDLSALSRGIYFVELRFAQQVVRTKLILTP